MNASMGKGVMRIILGLPSFSEPGNFQIAQNRQAQRFEHGAYIFPVILASAATMLKAAGHEVMWLDGPAEGLSWTDYLLQLGEKEPDLIVWEVKTPTVKQMWNLSKTVKHWLPTTRIAVVGDHVTALPEETLMNSAVDYVLTGGDYDFSLMKLVNNCMLEPFTIDAEINGKDEDFPGWPRIIKPARGVYDYGTDNKLTELPIIDRELCKWRLYGYEKGSGNYKYLPGTHTMFGRDCWWRHQGGCTFCSWTNTFKNWRVASVDQAMAEIESCASLGIREVFDDTGTFPIGSWLHDFCERMIKFNKGRKHGKARITMGCNMRPGALKEEDWKLMGEAGFRFILFGLESANQGTIEKINKGQADGDIENSCRIATKYGMDPHATCMVGYPWESKRDADRTINLTRDLFRKGWLKTLQATIVIPYPGTELFRQAEENGWLTTRDWNDYDMRRPVMKTPMAEEEVLAMTRGIYHSCITPQFIAKKLYSIRSVDDVKFMWKAAKFMLGHLNDFSGKQEVH
jgi:anaerobic magnesium-protoporphyrin IX monomethyl ester cyclase